MKSRTLLFIMLLILFFRTELTAQNCNNPPNCIRNPGIDGSGVGWGNPINTSLPNWWVQSGTPTLAQGMGTSSGFRLINGDAMGTCFNFIAGATYRVCFFAYTTNGQNGDVTLIAAGGTGTLPIGNVTVTKIGHAPDQFDIMFTATANFNRLLFSVNNVNHSVVIDDVGAIEVPAITAPLTIARGTSTTLALTANTIGNMTITWSPLNGLSGTAGASVTASPCKTTTYTATYTSQCSPMYSCNTNTVQTTVTVLPNGNLADSSDPFCFGPIDLRYTPTVPIPGTTYRWYDKNFTLVSSTGNRYFKNPTTTADEGWYTLVVAYPNGCIDTFTTDVRKNCCNVNADFSTMGCNPVRFVNNTVDGNTGLPALQGEWFWDFGDGTTSTLRNPAHLYTTIWGNTTVCLTTVVTNGNTTCCDRVCKDITLCDFGCAAKAAFDFVITDPNARDIQLFDKSVGIGSACVWNWTVDGVPIPGSSTNNPLVTGLLPGKHIICLDVEFCHPFGSNCIDAGWCEEIEIP